MTRVIGLDIHRVFAEGVMLDAGKIVPVSVLGSGGQQRRCATAFVSHSGDTIRDFWN
jgi:hypothetical protein